MVAYYNENDPVAAQHLINLIAAGVIAPGHVDHRDIRDVCPADLDGYSQCHFFAGVGVWSAALRACGWDDEKPVWTGSCPCQPFSPAGAQAGFDDERHLWPDWHWLIQQCRPQIVFGEQVASADGLDWIDLVSSDMEASDYSIGALDTCAAGYRSFHIRQRLYFVAENLRLATDGMVDAGRSRSHRGRSGKEVPKPEKAIRVAGRSHVDGLVNDQREGLEGQRGHGVERGESRRIDSATHRPATASDATRGLAHAHGADGGAERQQPGGKQRLKSQDGRYDFGDVWADASHEYWRDADWLFCRDERWRPVGPGTFPLAYEIAARMGRLRAYGNGLDLAQAVGFVRAYMERDMGDRSQPTGDLFEWGQMN